MPIQYTPTKHAFYTEGESLTDQEYKDSCDINKMISRALQGQEIRGSGPQQYGYDDTTMDAVTYRIQKEQLEESLSSGPKEFEKEELDLIPEKVKQKFGFKQKAQKNDEPKTTKPAPQNEAKKEPLPTPGTPGENA